MHYKQEAKAHSEARLARIRRACSGGAEMAKGGRSEGCMPETKRATVRGERIEGEAAKPRADRKRYARGGRTKNGKTEVNIVIAEKPNAPAAMPAPAAAAAPPPPPMPPRPPIPPMPPQGGAGMPPGAIPPGMMPRKRGGRAMSGGAGGGLGRLQKAAEYGTKP